MKPFLLGLVMLVTGAQPPPTPAERQPPPATAAIRGRVTAGDTGLPMRRAEVWLNKVESSGGTTHSTGARGDNSGTTTDAEGRYEFNNLPAGRYSVMVSKAPYVTGPLAPQAVNSRANMIELQPGETRDRVDFTLIRGGVITGRVVDEFGEPLSGLDVSARRVQTINGRRQLQPFGPQGLTNDIGEFRIFGLEPGQYAVLAVWRRMGPGDPASPDRTGYPSTYFPGTTNEAEAQRFTVAAGQTIGDLAMALSPIKTARVEGTVVDVDGRPMGNGYLEVLQSSANSNFMGRELVQPDGTFTFASLAPGDYVLRTQPTPARQNVALLKLTVGSEDIKDLRMVALPLAILSGRIVVDPSLPPPNAAQLSLSATPSEQPMPGGRPPAVVADDLTFELTAMPGRNHIASAMLPPGWTMRSVRVNNVEAIDDGFEVKPGEKITGVDIELTSKIAVVAGLVTNARGEPVKDCVLLVFPADSRRWNSGRYLRTARPEQDGRFKVAGLVPADYYLIAVDKLDGGQWPQHDFLDRIRAKATSVTIGEGETKTIDLKINSAQ
jgi:protocatechuate 3,4-dioxygenase beta subunit